MKNTKLLSLVALLLLCAMLFASCGNSTEGIAKASSYNTVLNPNYNLTADEISNVAEISEVSGYTFMEANDNFAVFSKDLYEERETTTKVVSLRNGSVVLSVKSTVDAVYSIVLHDETPTFVAHKRYGESLAKDRYTLYDAVGNAIDSQLYQLATPEVFADMILYNATLYEEDETGKLNEVVTIAENYKLSSPDAYSEKYFYFFNKYGVDVYDREFKFKASYVTPTGADYVNGTSDYTTVVLNNGNVLIQYAMQLDPETTTYDYLTESGNEFTKYDLCTYILNVEKNKATEIDVNYVIGNMISCFDLLLAQDDDAENSYFTDKFENLAVVYEIADKRINTRTTGADIVTINNNGKITSSLKLADNQSANLPTKIADNTYRVYTDYGIAIVNAKGDTLLTIYNYSLEFVGTYLVSPKAIYDLQMNTVYSLTENEATVRGTLNGTIFIAEEVNDTTYELICLRNGTTNSLCTIDTSDPNSNRFTVNDDDGYYAIYLNTTEQYSYYNAMGELLVTSDYPLNTVVNSSEHGTVILATPNNDFYLLSK